MSNMTQMHQQQLRPQSQQPPPAQQSSPQQIHMPQPLPGSMGSRTGTFDMSAPIGQQGPGQGFGPPPSMTAAGPGAGPQPGHERSFSHGGMLNQPNIPPAQQQYNQRNSTQAVSGSHQKYGNGGSMGGSMGGGVGGGMGGGMGPVGAPQLGALPFQSPQQRGTPSPPRQTGPPQSMQNPSYQQPDSVRSVSPPSTVAGPVTPSASKPKQVFGLSLDRLYERDGLAVPMAVYQCIQAVDLYGLAVEGIYRQSGSATHIQKLKNMFDTGKTSLPPSREDSPRSILLTHLRFRLP